MGTWDRGSQWCNRLLGILGFCGRFCFGKGSVSKEVMPQGWLIEITRRKGAGRLFWLWTKLHKDTQPHKDAFY
jgi:hypothetical protein